MASVGGAPQVDQLTDLFKSLSEGEEAGEVSGDYQQIPYNTVQKYQGYEERVYPSVKFACTDMTYQKDAEDDGGEGEGEWSIVTMIKQMANKKGWKKRPSSVMFMKLFRYISGVNVERQEVEMTVPVLTTMQELDGDKMYKQMCFYLPREHQESPPTPSEEGVVIQQLKEMTVLVKQFGGYAMRDWVWTKECQAFNEELQVAKDIELSEKLRDIDFSKCLTAGYDSPMKFWNRRNEVMFKVNNQNEV